MTSAKFSQARSYVGFLILYLTAEDVLFFPSKSLSEMCIMLCYNFWGVRERSLKTTHLVLLVGKLSHLVGWLVMMCSWSTYYYTANFIPPSYGTVAYIFNIHVIILCEHNSSEVVGSIWYSERSCCNMIQWLVMCSWPYYSAGHVSFILSRFLLEKLGNYWWRFLAPDTYFLQTLLRI